MNAASPDRSQAAAPEPAKNRNYLKSGRGLLATIMAVLLLWGLYLARGAFLLRHNFWQGALVIICVLAYLCFWGGMLVSRRTRLASTETEYDQTRYSKACVTGFSFSLLGFVLTLVALLLMSRSALSDRLTYVSLMLIPLGLLLSVIGLSDPRRAAGKKLGLSTFPLTLGWIVACVFYVVG
jgi:small-conductance mechanosensitive channel